MNTSVMYLGNEIRKRNRKKSCAVIKLTYMYKVTTLISYARLPDVSSRTQKHCQNKIASYLFKLFKKEYTYQFINS